MAQALFRKADNEERLKRCLKSRIHYSNDEFYFTGDRVFFKENGKLDWSGPAKVLGQEGKVVFLQYGNNLRRVHCTKLVKDRSEYESSHPDLSKSEEEELFEKSTTQKNKENTTEKSPFKMITK